MGALKYFLPCLVLFGSKALAQTVTEIWETTSDQQSLLAQVSADTVSFGSGDGGDATISVDASQVYQTIYGHGSSISDSAAYNMYNLKVSDFNAYVKLMMALFDPTPGAQSAGFNYIRVPVGASDFSPSSYSYADNNDGSSLSDFNVGTQPAYVWEILGDIQLINPAAKFHVCPWSPPGWMKDSNTMDGGNFNTQYTDDMANYLLKTVEAFKSKGFTPFAVSIQNEPQNSNPTLPSCQYDTSSEAGVAVALRKLLDSGGYSDVKVVGYEHNWDNAESYAVQLLKENGAQDAYAGVAFHCYAGDVANQDSFHNAYQDKDLFFTECTSVPGSDWWTDIQWYMNNLYIVGQQHWAQTGMMWNFASDGSWGPLLPGTSSCGDGCRAVVTVSDSDYQLNQEYYALAHMQKAVLPQSVGGPTGQRIEVSVQGNLVVGAYMTPQASNSTSGARYSIVVLNPGGDTKTSIEFSGKTASYTFKTGLTTLSWTD